MAAGSMLTALRTMVATVVALTGVMWAAKAVMDAWYGPGGTMNSATSSTTTSGVGSTSVAVDSANKAVSGTAASDEQNSTSSSKKKKKSKGSFGSAIATLRSSSKILHLACLVVGYALSHRVVRW